ncbi:MAG: transcriptional repressor [Spirochaetia bacterium]|nr:transcriptional repressor [Spirochaetia bacterium]
MTKARKALIEQLKIQSEPVTATTMAKHLPFDQATIYRNLHYLEEHGYAQSFILHCSEHGTERYYSYHSAKEGVHHHWFHCEVCHKFIDLGDCEHLMQLKQWEQEHGFLIHDHTFFLTGVCAFCKE